ncbi:MAG: DUF2971 domain-containing protein [Ignavibacteriae bacterium]|nr:DUF2971 domain-containing protein [Ignavibacteriota bacterium]
MNEGQYYRLVEANNKEIIIFCNEHKYIYRFLPLERLLDMLQNDRMIFVSPRKWKDTFDNFLFRVIDEKEINNTFLNKIYSLCFTLNPHSQAYWKTYSPEGHGVRIKIKTKDFLSILTKLENKIWIGRMKYNYEKILVEKLSQTVGLKQSLFLKEPNDLFLNMFHLKRMPFKYEEEIRLLILAQPKISGLRKVKLIPSDIIEEIRLDPNVCKAEEKALKEYLEQFKIKVTKSLLFVKKTILIQ